MGVVVQHLMIIDRSGSMGDVVGETISGLNKQLKSMNESQKKFDDQDQIGCMVLFDDEILHEDIWEQPIADIKRFTKNTYVPEGLTALYDAIGVGIEKLREEIKDELKRRESSVIVTIFTDGGENASRYYNGIKVANLVKEVQETGQWTVSFVGCGDPESVFDVAESMNIVKSNTVSYPGGSKGTKDVSDKMANARSCYSASVSSCLKDNIDMSTVQKGFYEENEEELI